MVIVEKERTVDVVHFLTDRINALNVESVRNAVIPLLEVQHSKVLIDLSGINYIDSTGFAMFLHLLRTAKSNYSVFKICSLTSSIQKLFSTLQLQTTFESYPDRDTCIKSF